jgi:trans-2,3-dihydro-3-hydroxyanthranilate isomerase
MLQPNAEPLPIENEAAVVDALGVQGRPLVVFGYRNGPEHIYVELASEGAVSALEPNLSLLARTTKAGVYAFFYDGKACRARCFVPGKGVSEDPATGSAVGPLALHLRRTGRLAAGAVLRVEQGIELGRPSTLYARIGDGPVPSIEVGGCAKIVARGQFVI